MKFLISTLLVFLSFNLYAQDRGLDLSRKAQSIAMELEHVQHQLTAEERRMINRNLNRIEDILGIWGGPGPVQVFCKHTGNNWYRLINLETGVEIDSSGTTQSQCEKRTQAVMGRVCKHTGNNWYRISTVEGVELDSSGTTYAKCEERLTANSKSRFSCKHTGNNWYRLVNQNGEEMDRSGTTLDKCTERLPGFRDQMFCKHTGNNWYRLTTLSGNELDSSGSTLSNCQSRIQ